MKNLSIANVLFLSVLILLNVTGCASKGTQQGSDTGNQNAENGKTSRIVYINTDTLMSQYLLAVELNEAFFKKQEERRTELNVKAKSLDQEANEFQRKLENNGFLSEARAIEARDQLLIKQEGLRRLQQEMIDKTGREQNELTKQLFDNLTAFLKKYNQEKKFEMVLSTQLGGNVLFAVDGYDITNDVVRGMNEEYKNSKK